MVEVDLDEHGRCFGGPMPLLFEVSLHVELASVAGIEGRDQPCGHVEQDRATPTNTSSGNPLGSDIRLVPKADNQAEGSAYSAFTQACPDVTAREPFFVLPAVGGDAAATDWICPP